MPRSKGSKNKNTGRRFRSFEGRFPDDKHLRLTKNMMDDPAYKSLTSSAKVLYSYMKLWACGRETVVYSASMAKDYMDEKTYRRARDELAENGFINYKNKYRARDMREVSEYEFSGRWQLSPNSFCLGKNSPCLRENLPK